MKEIEMRNGHVVSDRYKFFITTCGRAFKQDTRGNKKLTEMGYNIAHGYKRIRINDMNDKNVRRYYRVARLVALAYLDRVDEKEIVNHKNGNKQNDYVLNLEWCNISENTQHAYDINLVKDRGSWKGTPYSLRKNK